MSTSFSKLQRYCIWVGLNVLGCCCITVCCFSAGCYQHGTLAEVCSNRLWYFEVLDVSFSGLSISTINGNKYILIHRVSRS